MRVAFGIRDQRAIGNRGIRFLGLHYRSRELAVLRQQVAQKPVSIRVNLSDLGQISVQDVNGAWLVVPCEMSGFDGVSAEEWIATSGALRRKHAAKAKLREWIVLKALADIRKAGIAAAESVGIGPTVLTLEAIKKHERELFVSFDILVASHRGRAFEGLDDDTRDAAEQTDSAPSEEPDSVEEPASKRPGETRRRRGGFLA